MKKNRNVIHLSGRLTANANAFITKELAARNIKDVLPAHGDIFGCLFTQEAVTVTEIAQRTHRTKSTVSILISKLEKSGYVRRVTNIQDRRAARIELTTKGLSVQPAISEISQKLDERLEHVLSDDELAALECLQAKALKAF